MSVTTYSRKWRTRISRRSHELRVPDETVTWRIIYRLDDDAVVIAEVFARKTQTTLKSVIMTSRRRLAAYDAAADGEEDR